MVVKKGAESDCFKIYETLLSFLINIQTDAFYKECIEGL